MSDSKKFLELQDMILLRTSLEKVRLHVDSRKEKTVYRWVMEELKEFLRKGSKYGCEVEAVYGAIQLENWQVLLNQVNLCLERFKMEIEEKYREMSSNE
ncbi:MAG: hypothetical protein RXS23_04000 [Metallosphaera yellowstonensis]|jgi:hypothetical protein|uniref:Uncharacterized protein n=1 Tax=Metallosphaera yellowstonensis MK1 TaxID=671065 RepID=H2C901_9CREN|nr:hypothetical protein [Metallosphaera yellowstonensis]EHP68627.1 hypothetical protein MetMK1DRAFT_00030700 [Metallosphaera yellowstonensis MK1]